MPAIPICSVARDLGWSTAWRRWPACSTPNVFQNPSRRIRRSRCPSMAGDSSPTSSSLGVKAIEHGAAERVKRHGLTIVYTGNGKGKTTAAIGLVIRAVGNQMRVFFLQFIKGSWQSGERSILRGLSGVDLEVTGRGFTIEELRDPRIPMDDHAAAAAYGWQVARAIVSNGHYDVVVLDEVLAAVPAGLVPVEALVELV